MANLTSKFRRNLRRQKKRVGESEIRRIVRENIKGRRLLLGLPQWELAEKVGVSQSWIHQYEDPDDADQAKPDLFILEALADALECTVRDLVTPGQFANGLSITLPRAWAAKRRRELRVSS